MRVCRRLCEGFVEGCGRVCRRLWEGFVEGCGRVL